MTKIISKRGREKLFPVHEEKPYTLHQLEEFRKCYADPVYFINTYFKILHPVRGASDVTLKQHQEEYVNAAHRAKNILAMMPRQQGSTMTSVAYILWEALFTPHQKIFAHGFNRGLADHILEVLRFAITNLPPFMRGKLIRFNHGLIEFDNNSKIFVGIASAYAYRGHSFTRVFIDGFANMQAQLQKDIWMNIMPVTGHGAKVMFVSTPNGKGNTFYGLWVDALKPNSTFTPFKRTADDCNVPLQHQQMIQSQVGMWSWRQEYMCEFL